MSEVMSLEAKALHRAIEDDGDAVTEALRELLPGEREALLQALHLVEVCIRVLRIETR